MTAATADFRAMLDAIAAKQAAFLALCEGDVVELAHPSLPSAALVLEDVYSSSGQWRVSTFDSVGAVRHWCERTREKALLSAWGAGFREPKPGAVDAVIDWSKPR